MDRPVPDGFVQTHLAIQEYVLDDRGWKRRELLLKGRKGLKHSTKERIRRSENFRLDHLYAHVRAAISKGELVPKAWVKRHARWYALPPAYWEGTSVDDSLWTGEVIEIDKAIPAKDRALLRDALVCFDRDEWEAWIAARLAHQSGDDLTIECAAASDTEISVAVPTLATTTAGVSTPSKLAPQFGEGEAPVDDETIKAWMAGEVVSRRKRRERTSSPIIVAAARTEFRDRGLGERHARALYKTLDKKWKGKRGPRG